MTGANEDERIVEFFICRVEPSFKRRELVLRNEFQVFLRRYLRERESGCLG